jgi:hypothetical protein
VLTAEALLYNKYADGSGNLPETSPYADEAEDIPSLVFGALCGGIARLKHAKGLFEEATPEHDQWQDLEVAFWNTFQPFYAEALVDGVLIVKRQRQSMGAGYDRETGIIESIEIDVFDQDVKPEEVRGLYEEMLNSGNLRHDRSDTGQLSWKIYRESIRIVVRPKDPTIDPLSRISHDVVPQQAQFPSPELVGGMYDLLRGSEAKGRFAGFGSAALPKWRPSDPGAKRKQRRGPGAHAKTLIPACVAWFFADRGRLLTQADKPRIAGVLNDVLLVPFKLKRIEATTAYSPVWENAKKWSEFFGKIERSFTEAPIRVGRHADRYL